MSQGSATMSESHDVAVYEPAAGEEQASQGSWRKSGDGASDGKAAARRCESQCLNVELTEDLFGIHRDELGKPHSVKRFTWRNANRIQVQAITYGAIVTSMRFPDRKGEVDDVVLGYDRLEGYLNRKDGDLGGTMGRCTGVVLDGTYVLDRKQYWLRPNCGRHHRDGGLQGYHRRLWKAHVEGTKVVMSLADEDVIEGYTGTVLVTVTFELSPVNEFKICMEARTTEPTIINLSNLTYLNLGGHHAGPDEIYHTVLTLNCNCYTKQRNGLPTGDIMNVVHTRYDLQVPKTLGRVMSCNPKQGYDQNFCVNRAMDQEDAFVARLLHPRSGRMVEVYSNQPGVRVETGNEWGSGKRDVCVALEGTADEVHQVITDRCLSMAHRLHGAVMADLHADCQNEYRQLRELIHKVAFITKRPNVPPPKVPNPSAGSDNAETKPSCASIEKCTISQTQEKYLRTMLAYCERQFDEQDYNEMGAVLQKILVSSLVQHESGQAEEEPSADATIDHTVPCEPPGSAKDGGGRIPSKSSKDSTGKASSAGRAETTKAAVQQKSSNHSSTKDKDAAAAGKEDAGRVRGKGDAVYQMHGGIALQTQNYPNAVNFRGFPSPVLYPGDTYRHTITYKFWVKAGQPAKWLRRNRML